MTLVYVRAFSRKEASDYALLGSPGLLPPLRPPLGHQRQRVVRAHMGFYGPEGASPFVALTHDAPHLVRMDDVHHAMELVDGTQAVPPSTEIARGIVEYLRPFAQGPAPWALLVHCYAGVSRSGAVAHWAWQRWGQGIPAAEFARLNARIHPNQRLHTLLEEASR